MLKASRPVGPAITTPVMQNKPGAVDKMGAGTAVDPMSATAPALAQHPRKPGTAARHAQPRAALPSSSRPAGADASLSHVPSQQQDPIALARYSADTKMQKDWEIVHYAVPDQGTYKVVGRRVVGDSSRLEAKGPDGATVGILRQTPSSGGMVWMRSDKAGLAGGAPPRPLFRPGFPEDLKDTARAVTDVLLPDLAPGYRIRLNKTDNKEDDASVEVNRERRIVDIDIYCDRSKGTFAGALTHEIAVHAAPDTHALDAGREPASGDADHRTIYVPADTATNHYYRAIQAVRANLPEDTHEDLLKVCVADVEHYSKEGTKDEQTKAEQFADKIRIENGM